MATQMPMWVLGATVVGCQCYLTFGPSGTPSRHYLRNVPSALGVQPRYAPEKDPSCSRPRAIEARRVSHKKLWGADTIPHLKGPMVPVYTQWMPILCGHVPFGY